MTPTDEFYVGYEGGMPPGARRVVRAFVAGAAIVTFAVALTIVLAQRPLAKSRFEFGRPRSVEGYLQLEPAPSLVRYEHGQWTRQWLVSQGKFGPARGLGAVRDGWVRLTGTVIEREMWRMLEVTDGSVEPLPPQGPPPPAVVGRPSSHVTLRGEIVDSKCFLGVMNPGERTVHRDCAIRCLAGGIPPMLHFTDARGARLALVMATADELRPLVGRTVEVTGTLIGSETDLVLVVEAAR